MGFTSYYVTLVKPTDCVAPCGTLNHLHKITFHLSLLGSSENIYFGCDCVTNQYVSCKHILLFCKMFLIYVLALPQQRCLEDTQRQGDWEPKWFCSWLIQNDTITCSGTVGYFLILITNTNSVLQVNVLNSSLEGPKGLKLGMNCMFLIWGVLFFQRNGGIFLVELENFASLLLYV